jgi:hypothetical protein
VTFSPVEPPEEADAEPEEEDDVDESLPDFEESDELPDFEESDEAGDADDDEPLPPDEVVALDDPLARLSVR